MNHHTFICNEKELFGYGCNYSGQLGLGDNNTDIYQH